MTAKELREKRATLATQMRALADKISKEARAYTAEEEANWTAINKDYDALTPQITRAERLEAVEAEQKSAADAEKRDIGRGDIGKPPPTEGRKADGPATEEQRAVALQAWFRHQIGEELDENHVAACRAAGIRPQARHLDFKLMETPDVRNLADAYRTHHPSVAKRALSAVVGATGGFTVPETMVRNIELAMLQFGGMMQASEILRTAGGEQMNWPTANDTGNKGRRLAENAVVDTTKTVTFRQVSWGAYKYTSDAILVPNELLEDSAFNLPSLLGSMLGERIGRIMNEEFTTGTGAVMPNGLVTAATTGKTAASATAFTTDEIIALVHSVDPAYRIGAGFMMHDGIVLATRLLKDGQGRYIWQSGMNSGAPDTLLGYSLTINQSMQATVATAKRTMLFGQLNKYKIRQVNQMRIYRLQERYRDNDQDAFLAFTRADGNLLDAGVAPVKALLQA